MSLIPSEDNPSDSNSEDQATVDDAITQDDVLDKECGISAVEQLAEITSESANDTDGLKTHEENQGNGESQVTELSADERDQCRPSEEGDGVRADSSDAATSQADAEPLIVRLIWCDAWKKTLLAQVNVPETGQSFPYAEKATRKFWQNKRKFCKDFADQIERDLGRSVKFVMPDTPNKITTKGTVSTKQVLVGLAILVLVICLANIFHFDMRVLGLSVQMWGTILYAILLVRYFAGHKGKVARTLVILYWVFMFFNCALQIQAWVANKSFTLFRPPYDESASPFMMLGPVYRPVKITNYYSDGNVMSSMKYEYDEHGNPLKRTYILEKTEYIDGNTIIVTWDDYDSVGCNATCTDGNGLVSDVEWEIRGGRPVKELQRGDGTTSTYEYYPDGRVKNITTFQGNQRDTTTVDYEMHMMSQESLGGENPSDSVVTWNTDDNGFVKSYTSKMTKDGETSTHTYKVQCDENGNVVTIWDDNGALYSKKEYVRIDNPSTKVWIDSQVPDFR